MGTGNLFKSDLYNLYDYVTNPIITYPKELFIETLREFFSQDSYYHYQRDNYGYPLVTDHTDERQEAGLLDDTTTRLFIGEPYRNDNNYYPCLLIRHGGARSVPISINRDRGSVQWTNTIFEDGYGNQKIIKTPEYFVRNGAWEGTITVEIQSRSPRAADDLSEHVAILFVDEKREDMQNAGVVILKEPSISGPSESDDRTGKIHKRTVTFEIRSEWRRQSRIDDVIDVVNICFEFGDIVTQIYSPNLTIHEKITLANVL